MLLMMGFFVHLYIELTKTQKLHLTFTKLLGPKLQPQMPLPSNSVMRNKLRSAAL